MPIVPPQKQQISMDVWAPEPQAAGATAIGSALGGLGQALAQTSQGFLEQIKRAEAKEASSKAAFDDYSEIDAYYTRIMRENPDGYIKDERGEIKTNPDKTPRTISQEFVDWADERFKRNQERMPSFLAQEEYKEKSRKMFEEYATKIRNDEWVLRVKTFDRGASDDKTRLITRMTTEFSLLPDLPPDSRDENGFDTSPVGSYYGQVDLLESRINEQTGILYSAQAAFERVQTLRKEAPDGPLQGLYNKALLDKTGRSAKFALNWLYGKDRESLARDPNPDVREEGDLPTLRTSMDPDKHQQWTQRFTQLLKAKTREDGNDWVQRADRNIESILSGDGTFKIEDMPEFISQGLELKSDDDKSISDINMAEKPAEMFLAARAKEALTGWQYYTMNSADKQKEREKIREDAIGYANAFLAKHFPERAKELSTIGVGLRARLDARLDHIIRSAREEAGRDFPAFTRNNPAVKAVADAIDYNNPQSLNDYRIRNAIRQDDQNIEKMHRMFYRGEVAPPVQYLTREATQTITKILESPIGSDQKHIFLRNLHRSNPGTFNEKLLQLVNSGLDKKWLPVLSMSDDPVFEQQLVNSIANPPKDAEAILAARGSSPDALKSDIAKESMDYIRSLQAANPDSPMSNYIQDAHLGAMYNSAMQGIIRGETPTAAAKNAVRAFVDRRFIKIKVKNGLFSNVDYRLPRNVNGVALNEKDQTRIEESLASMSLPGRVEALNPDIPSNLPAVLAAEKTSDITGTPTGKFQEVVRRSLRFRPNAANTAVVPQWFSVYHNKMVDLLKDGQPITIPILKLRDPLPPVQGGGLIQKAGDKIKEAVGAAFGGDGPVSRGKF